jgi:hypothetical protein
MSITHRRLAPAAALAFLVTMASACATSRPYKGHAARIPGVVQMEDFDDGPPGIAYYDSTPTNEGGYYRDTGVDIELCEDEGGGMNVAFVTAGEWLKYTVDVAFEGVYTVRFRVASEFEGGVFHLEGGSARSEAITMPNTTWWQFWKDVYGRIQLKKGRQVIRFVVDSTLPGRPAGNFNYMEFTLDGGPRPTAATLSGSVPSE